MQTLFTLTTLSEADNLASGRGIDITHVFTIISPYANPSLLVVQEINPTCGREGTNT